MLLDAFDMPLVPRFGHAQRGDGGDTIWRDEPNEEVDKAWERVTEEKIIRIKRADVIAIGKDPARSVVLPKKYNVDGEETYMAKGNAFHNLHCVDYIRKDFYKDYYYPNGTQDMPFHRNHIQHCFMVLWEALTCQPDLGIYSKSSSFMYFVRNCVRKFVHLSGGLQIRRSG